MRSLDKPFKWLVEVADAGDRCFVAFTSGVAHVGAFARREAWIAADSAVAALATTLDVAKRISPPPRAPQVSSVLADGLDVLPAIPSSLGVPSSTRANPPGVAPVLQALGRTVAKHTHAGYVSLESDPRFWTLVDLLQKLRTSEAEASEP
jgi:hypothetical protein